MIIELRRDELYVMVWQHPVGPLSARLGMSSAKRREACRVMSIPLPPLGHWQKIVAPAAPALLPRDGPYVFTIGTPPLATSVDGSKTGPIEHSAKTLAECSTAPAALDMSPLTSGHSPCSEMGSPISTHSENGRPRVAYSRSQEKWACVGG